MRCPRCGYHANPAQSACPRCGARLTPPPRPGVVRVRRGGKRRAAWYGPSAGYRRRAPLWRRPSRRVAIRRMPARRRPSRRALILAALGLAALIASIALIARLPRGAQPPEPGGQTIVATSKPGASATPTPAATPTAAPGPAPSPEPVGIAGREDLIALYWRMIRGGANRFTLDEAGLDEADFTDVTEKFSNYFDAYNVRGDVVTMTLKPGLRVLLAIEAGDTDALSDELREIAGQAQAVVAELIEPGMTDVEKELAIHDYIAGHCEYLESAQGAHTEDVRGFFQRGQCQCTGYVDTFRLLGRLAGLEVEMIGGPTTRDRPGAKGHAWNLIRLDGLWYVVDVTWDDGGDSGATEHTYFNLPSACFGDSRSWDQSCCPDGDYAAALDARYYYGGAPYAVGTRAEALESAVRQLDAGGTAYLRFTGADLAREVSADLVAHYGARGRCVELSKDLDFALYKFARS